MSYYLRHSLNLQIFTRNEESTEGHHLFKPFDDVDIKLVVIVVVSDGIRTVFARSTHNLMLSFLCRREI